MKARINFLKHAPKAVELLQGLERYIRESGVEHTTLELVKMRASQINGCAYCLDMHSKDARAAGETEQRLYLLDAWREVALYSPRERAALEWTEAVTLVADGHVPDEVYASVREQFDEKDLVTLTLAVAAINCWNRLSISMRAEAGGYKPGMHGV